MNLLSLMFNYQKNIRNYQKMAISYKVKNMKNIIIDEIKIDNLESYVIQGICTTFDNILISAYDSEGKLNSKIIMLDKNYNFIKNIDLNMQAHVGGICYDEVHNNIWVTDKSGTISCYSYDDIKKLTSVFPKIKKLSISEHLINVYGNKAVAYISFFDSKIYLGNFNKANLSVVKCFDVNRDGSLDLTSVKEYLLDAFVQGLAIKKIDKKIYMLISSSYGINKSNLNIYDMDNLTNPIITCRLPAMLEGITFDQDGKLLGVYESNAKKYKNFFINNNDVVKYDIEEIIINRIINE